MARAKWKFSFLNKKIWRFLFFIIKDAHSTKNIFNFFVSDDKYLQMENSFFKKKRIYAKSAAIPSIFLDTNIVLYKGRHPIVRKVTPDMIGHKFGSFVFTRKPAFFTPKEKKRKNIKR